jgi:tricorn protease interacting factor F2/3
MQVKCYELFLDIDFENLQYRGRVVIELQSDKDIILNSLDLNILDIRANETSISFEQDGEDLVIKTGAFIGKLIIEYTGLIPDSLVGIYRAPYNNTYMLTTQLESSHARRIFPCMDHPEYKAEFELTLSIKEDLDAISNMPVDSIRVEDGKKVITFQKTPKMSTYLLYIGISKFEEVKERIGNTNIIVATTPGKSSKGAFALKTAKESLDFCESYFNIPYMLPKLHLISVPEFAAGAMENWGAMTFRESALHVDEGSSIQTRRLVVEVVAHELVHQWFGNLVTMKWWNDLWLNESFATFMSYKVVDDLYPEWRSWEDFLISRTSRAMARDSLRNTHPIDVKITSPAEIREIFDEISYGKGASILRMIEDYMGTENFQNGVRDYLNNYKYSNASGTELWRSLEKASGKQVKRIMREWIQKPGYPIVSTIMKEGKLCLKQERFFLSGESEKDIWPLPITLELDGETRRLLLDSEETYLESKGVKSLKVNLGQRGFYRVYYGSLYEKVWKSELSILDKWSIVFDALAFLASGRMTFTEYLEIVKRYYEEEDYLPAHEVSDQLQFFYAINPTSITEISRKFHRTQFTVLEGKTDETSSMLRGIIARRLALTDDDYAKELGDRFYDYEMVEPDMKGAVASAFARATGDLERIVMKYRESESDEDRIRLIQSMMSIKDQSLIALALGFALSGEVKRQDIGSMLLASIGNPEAGKAVWIWLKMNIERLRKIYEGTGFLSRILLSAIPFLGIGRAEEVEEYFLQNQIDEAETGIKAGLERLKIYEKLVERIR